MQDYGPKPQLAIRANAMVQIAIGEWEAGYWILSMCSEAYNILTQANFQVLLMFGAMLRTSLEDGACPLRPFLNYGAMLRAGGV